MLYMYCPSCNTLLGDKQIYYETKLKKICESQFDKDENLVLDKKEEIDKQKKALLDELELHNICCRMRMLTYTRLIDIVQ